MNVENNTLLELIEKSNPALGNGIEVGRVGN